MASGEYNKFSSAPTFYFHSDKSKTSNTMGNQHYHNVYELYYLTEGSCSYFIEDRSYDIQAGDLVIIPERTIHKTTYPSGAHARKLINFSRHYLPKSAIASLASLTYVYRNREIAPVVDSLFGQIEEEYKRRDDYTDDVLKSYVRLLILTLARNKNEARGDSSGSEFIESAVKYIRESYAQEVTLEGVARMHSVSPEHLSRCFKRETGFGFCEYLGLIRLQHAEQLLSTAPDMSISEVAYSSGFNDSNYFSDRFKREYGVSPMKFRNSRKK